MNAYFKLFTTNPPTVTKNIPPFSIVSLLFIIVLLIVAAFFALSAIKAWNSTKKATYKFERLFDTAFPIIAAVISLATAVILAVVNCKPTHQKVIASNAPQIEKAAIQQAHQEYPYVLTIKSSWISDESSHYLLKCKPNKGIVDMYKLKFDEDIDVAPKPYVKHVGYRALPISKSYSINDSTSYLHDKVIDEDCGDWNTPGQKPGNLLSLFENYLND